jgi:hypothetical protein
MRGEENLTKRGFGIKSWASVIVECGDGKRRNEPIDFGALRLLAQRQVL